MDLLTAACSFLVGGTAATFATKSILVRKWRRKIDALAVAHDRELNTAKNDLISTFESREHELHKQIINLHKMNVLFSQDLAIREREILVVSSSETEYLEADSSARMYELFCYTLQRSLAPQLTGGLLFSSDESGKLLASDIEVTAIDLTTILPDYMPGILPDAQLLQSIDEAHPLRGLYPNARSVTVLPLSCRDRHLGIACLLWSSNQPEDHVRLARKILTSWSSAMYRVLRYEHELNCNKFDRLTTLPNNIYFDDLVPHILRHSTVERPTSLILIECDNLKEINDRYGHTVGDQMVRELAEVITTSARVEQLYSKKRPPDHFFRYTGLQFIAVLEESHAAEATTVAERIRAAVEEKRDWAGGVPKWSISAGVATYPHDANDCQQLRVKAEVALMFSKEKLGGNQSIHFEHVPRAFRTTKLSARVGGSLEVFDPCTALQSIAHSGKTGIFTVTSADGRVFWAFVQQQRLMKAHMGAFKSDLAIIEFISTFDEGAFTFQEYASLSNESLEALHRMDVSYDVQRSLEKVLMDGIRAQEMLSAARRLMPETKLFVRPSRNADEFLARLKESAPQSTPLEMQAMETIYKHANGRTMLSSIFDRLDSVPTYIRWHAGSMLLQNHVVELSKLGIHFLA